MENKKVMCKNCFFLGYSEDRDGCIYDLNCQNEKSDKFVLKRKWNDFINENDSCLFGETFVEHYTKLPYTREINS